MKDLSTSIPIESSSGAAVKQESTVQDFIALLKPRVMSLVVFTGAIGMFLAPGSIHPFIGMIAIMCIALASGASGAINMWYDADIDAIMERTKKRPIPSGKVSADEALSFGVITALFSVLLMWMATNVMAAMLLAAAILFYVFIYTIYLKRRTAQNIVIGGAAGSFPPMIGWAAVTGTVSFESVILFLIIFVWTPAHFWALALYKSEDYKKANVPMLPVVSGEKTTKINILLYTLLTVVVTFLPIIYGFQGVIYGVVAVILNLFFIKHAINVWFVTDNQRNSGKARKMFFFSILYLFLLYASMPIDKMINF
ncbi:MAG: heme o synthase [Rickettsiales bacterium]|nr:heme o synthase [Rickettsiales bacterium]